MPPVVRKRTGLTSMPPAAEPIEPQSIRGWASARRNLVKNKKSFDDPHEFKVAAETTYIVKILEDEPFGDSAVHFINEIREGKRSFVCPGEDTCPLCGLGDRPRPYTFFNVAVREKNKPGDWRLQYWKASPDPSGKLLDHYDRLAELRNPRSLADDSLYLAVSKGPSRARGKSFTEYSVQLVECSRLDDYGVQEITDAEYEAFESRLFNASVIQADPLSMLTDAASKLMADDVMAGQAPPF